MQILILKPSSLGDIVCSLPVAQSIRDQMPEAVISWVVKTRFAEIVRRCPAVNGKVIEFPHASGIDGLKGLWKTLKSLRGQHFDVVLDFQGLLRSGLMSAVVKSPKKLINPDAKEFSWLASHKVVGLPAGGRETHATERLLQFLPEIGLEPEVRSPAIVHGDCPLELDSRLASSPVVLVPNSRGVEKEWPYYPELAVELLSADPEVLVAMDSHLRWEDPPTPHLDRFINLTSRSSMMQMFEVIRGARLVIANDSGPLHIAAAMGIPTLGLHGPTNPKRTGPYPLNIERNNVLASASSKIEDIDIADVLKKTLQILRGPAILQRVAA